MTENILAALRVALGYKSLGEFGRDWKLLSDKDKQELKSAIENGSMTY